MPGAARIIRQNLIDYWSLYGYIDIDNKLAPARPADLRTKISVALFKRAVEKDARKLAGEDQELFEKMLDALWFKATSGTEPRLTDILEIAETEATSLVSLMEKS